jgi:hypothetical protein
VVFCSKVRDIKDLEDLIRDLEEFIEWIILDLY